MTDSRPSSPSLLPRVPVILVLGYVGWDREVAVFAVPHRYDVDARTELCPLTVGPVICITDLQLRLALRYYLVPAAIRWPAETRSVGSHKARCQCGDRCAHARLADRTVRAILQS